MRRTTDILENGITIGEDFEALSFISDDLVEITGPLVVWDEVDSESLLRLSVRIAEEVLTASVYFRVTEDGLARPTRIGGLERLDLEKLLALYGRVSDADLADEVVQTRATPASRQRPRLKWTLAECMRDALKYASRLDWQRASGSAYRRARKEGWLEECCAHMERLQRGSWTLGECKSDALKYTSRSDWARVCKPAYERARRQGWLEECCAHMELKRRPPRTFEECREDALQYSRRSDWERASSSTYHRARRQGWLEECCRHMGR